MTQLDAVLGTISWEGEALELGSGLNFTGSVTVTRNTDTGKIDIAITGGGGSAHTIENAGVAIVQRTSLNFVGFTTADVGGKSTVTLPAINLAGSGSGGVTGQLPTAGHADDSITYAKQQNVSAASRLIGRGSAAGAGDPQEITPAGGVEMSGTNLQRSALTGAVSAAAGSNTTAFASGAFGALDLSTTGFLSLAATPAASGSIRWGSNTSYSLVGRTTGGSDQVIVQWDPATPRIILGATGAGVTGHVYLNNGGVQLRIGTDYVAQVLSGQLQLNSGTDLTIVAGQPINIHPLDSTGSGATAGNYNSHAGDATSGAGGGTGGSRFDRAGNATGASGTRNGGDYDLQAGGGGTASGTLSLRAPDPTGALGTKRIAVDATGIGFFNTAPVAKPTITGSRGGNAALADLLTKLADFGLITDGTSA